jgi:glycine/D-amino acid oxidase-like deaminating enzyme
VSQPREIGTLVIGGGILGRCVAGFLAEEGADVAIVDDGRVGGSTANAGSIHVQMQSRFIRLYPHLADRTFAQLAVYTRAARFWQEFEAHLGADFEMKMSGGLMVAENREQLDFLAQKARREQALGVDVEILETARLRDLAPYLGESAYGAELCPLEGKLNPLQANAAVAGWLARLGVVVLANESARSMAREGRGFVVTTGGGPIRAGRVVVAAGAFSKGLAAQLGVSIPARAEPLHMNITEAAEPVIGHLVQHAELPITLKQFGTGQVVIGGGWPAHLHGERGHPTVELASLVGNATLAQHLVPQIGQLQIIRTWAGINTSVDGCSVLGETAAVPGLVFAIPGDAGYTLSPFLARMLVDALLGRSTEFDMRMFTPERFAG